MFPWMLELMYFTESQDLPSVSVEPHKMNHFHIASHTQGWMKMKNRALSMKYKVESLITELQLVS